MAEENDMLDSEYKAQENTLVVSGTTGNIGRVSIPMDSVPQLVAIDHVEPITSVDAFSSLCARIATLERQVEDYEEKFKKIDTLYELLVNEG